jgi:hypothetical protein
MNAYVVFGILLLGFGVYMVSPMLFPARHIREHTGVSKDAFVSQLSTDAVPEAISCAVYDFYEQEGHCKTFHPSPEMDICDTFNYDPEEIDDAAKELLKQLNLESPSEGDRLSWPGGEVRTAGDLARWLYWASQHQPT